MKTRIPPIGWAQRNVLNLEISAKILHVTHLKCHPHCTSLPNVSATRAQSIKRRCGGVLIA